MVNGTPNAIIMSPYNILAYDIAHIMSSYDGQNSYVVIMPLIILSNVALVMSAQLLFKEV